MHGTFRPIEVRREGPYLAALVSGLIALYAATMPRTVTLEDSGFFLTSCAFAGISHPPGYPLHGMACHLFSLLPWGSVAVRVSLLSALCGALTCAVLALIGRGLWPGRRLIPYTVAFAYGASRAFWSQAIIAEVYTLNTLLFFCQLYGALVFSVTASRRVLRLTAFCFGLGLANHWPLMLLSGPALALVLWPRRGEALRLLPGLVACTGLGLLPYLYLFLRSRHNPVFSFLGPMETLADLWRLVSLDVYREGESDAVGPWTDKLRYLGFLAVEATRQYTPLGILLAALGVLRQFRQWRPSLALGLTWAALASSVGIVLLPQAPPSVPGHAQYDYLSAAVLSVYPLIPYGVMALWIMLGLAAIQGVSPVRARAAAPALAGLLLAATVASNVRHDFRAHDRWAHEYARAVLDSLPRDAVFFSSGDRNAPIAYVRLVLGVRPDVTLYNESGYLYDTRLFRPGPGDRDRKRAIVAKFMSETPRPLCYTNPHLPRPHGVQRRGPYYCRIRPEEGPAAALPEPLVRLADLALAPATSPDRWTHHHRDWVIGQLAATLMILSLGEDAPADVERLLPRLQATYSGAIASVGVLLATPGAGGRAARDLLDRADALAGSALSRQDSSRRFLYRARCIAEEDPGRLADIARLYLRAIDEDPNPTNPAVSELVRHYLGSGQPEQAGDLLGRFPGAFGAPFP